jgi:hypothetical protein
MPRLWGRGTAKYGNRAGRGWNLEFYFRTKRDKKILCAFTEGKVVLKNKFWGKLLTDKRVRGEEWLRSLLI